MIKIIGLFILLFVHVAVFAQITVTGVVTDEEGLSVIGAMVQEKGTDNRVLADFNGKFSIKASPDAVLEISSLGFELQKVPVNGRAIINVVLKMDADLLDAVVVTGYGGRQLRAEVTNSIASVKEETFTVGMFSNPAQALSGAVAGLRVIQTSGDPGSAPTIVLRGGTTLDGKNTSPLVYVDGQLRSSLSDINPDDIESMEILKDAGATALYGARASNGVILVTTKTGKIGHAQINFNAKLGWNFVNNPYEFLNAEQYISTSRQMNYDSQNLFMDKDGNMKGYSPDYLSDTNMPYSTGNVYGESVYSTMAKTADNAYLLGKGWQEMEDPLNPGRYIIFKDTDIPSYNINTPSLSQNYNMNMSGGNEKATYYAGLGYNHSEGMPIDTFYERFSFLVNASYKITDFLLSTSSVNYNRANWRNLSDDPRGSVTEQNYFGRYFSMPPTVRFEDEDGNMLLGAGKRDENYQYQKDKFEIDNQSDKFTLSQSFKVDFMKGFYLNIMANWYIDEQMKESFAKDYESTPGIWERARKTKAEYQRDFAQTYNAVLHFDREFNRHSLNMMLGGEMYDTRFRKFNAEGQLAPTDDFGDLGLSDKGENRTAIDSQHTRMRILSLFGRINYDYDGKYLLSAVFRNDGYSTLLGENRWGFFPGISAGWIFSRESFIKDAIPVLSFGKLRASYGVNGNASGIGRYQLQGEYKPQTYNGNTGYLVGELPNPALRWERTTTFEVGLDLSFFENRLNFNAVYYNRLTNDKYADLSFPTATGFSSILNNNGKFRNRGVEFEISGNVLATKDWRWDISANIAYNKNVVVELPGNGLEKNRQGSFEIYTGNGDEKKWVGGYQEGQEPNVLYAYQADGIYNSYDEIPGGLIDKVGGSRLLYGPDKWNTFTAAEQDTKTKMPIQPGDVKWKDVNGDGIIDQYDKVEQGNLTPRWIGGFNTNLSWKGLTLYARFDYALDFVVYDGMTPWFLGCMQGTYNATTDIYNTWTEDNQNADYPRYLWADQLGKNNTTRTSSMFVDNGSYLALRELSLTYSLPKAWINKIKVQKLDISVTGQNLGYLTASKIANPGNHSSTDAASNIGGGGYPLPRTFLVGINLTF